MSFIQSVFPDINPEDWKDEVDEFGWFHFDEHHEIALGENDATITAINETGDMVQVTIGEESDSIHLKYFSDIILESVATTVCSLI